MVLLKYKPNTKITQINNFYFQYLNFFIIIHFPFETFALDLSKTKSIERKIINANYNFIDILSNHRFTSLNCHFIIPYPCYQ